MNAVLNMNAKNPEIMDAIKSELADLVGVDDPSTWTPADLLQALRSAKEQRRAGIVNRQIDLAGVNWQKKRDTFLGYTCSEHTRRAYDAALGKLENWAVWKGINPLELNAAGADRFIHDMKAEGRAAASVRRDVAGVSAFYTFLERETEGKIKNPVRGTRLRPASESKKDIVIPSKDEYEAILAGVPLKERAMLAALALRGLRAGALPTLVLKDGKYHGKSKGKALKENGSEGITLPAAVVDAMAAAGLNMKKPFAWKTRQKTVMNASAVESRINKHLKRLYQEGKIGAAFSAHDFRHFFAVQEYGKDNDIYRVSVLLGHANVAITQTYLKSLKVKL